MNYLTFLFRRASRYWQMLLTLSLGVILATILLASAPILVQTVVEFGLRRTLVTAVPLDANLLLNAFPESDFDLNDYATFDEQIRPLLHQHLGDTTADIIPTGNLRWLFPWVDGELRAQEGIFFRFYGGLGSNADSTDIRNHIDFVAGNWPDELLVEENVLAAVIGEELASAYDLTIGDRLPMSSANRDELPNVWLEVAGIARATNPLDPYWFGEFSPLRVQSSSRWDAEYSAIVPAADLFTVAELLGFRPQLSWHVLLDPEQITFADIPTLQQALSQLEFDLRSYDYRPSLATSLPDILQTFATQSTAIRSPLYLLTIEVVLLALYYVTMVAALAVKQVEREFAVLRSRGASGRQIAVLQLGEALILAVIALLSGPFLASLLVQGLAAVGPLADVGQAEWAFLSIPQAAWIAAGGATAVSVIALMLPVGPALERSIVTYQAGARGEKKLWWQRYYLDIILLVVGIVLLWRLQTSGGLVGGGSSAPRVDWLLLLSPVALLLGAGTILLRLFPLMLRLGAAIAARRRDLAPALAMWQASRNPTHIARLVLLLTLAMALGILATGLNATLDQSEFERSRYQAGSDIRIGAKQFVPASTVSQVDGVETAAATIRTTGSLNVGRRYLRFDLLGVEPFSLAEVALFREDFSEQPMGELLGRLAKPDEGEAEDGLPVIELPGQPGEIGIWLWAPRENRAFLTGTRALLLGNSDLDRVGIRTKVETAVGETHIVRLQPVVPEYFEGKLGTIHLRSGGYPSDGWRYFTAEMPQLGAEHYPLSFHSLWLQNRARGVTTFLIVNMDVAVDDLTVVDAQTGAETIVTSFDDPAQLWDLDDGASWTRHQSSDAHAGDGRLGLTLNYARTLQRVGLKPIAAGEDGRTPPLLPVLANPTFLETSGLKIGDVVEGRVDSLAVTYQLVGTVNYFPTLEESDNAGFLITAREALLTNLNERSSTAYNANEVMIGIGETAVLDTVSSNSIVEIPNFTTHLEAETIRRTIKADPMALGLRSVTFFGYTLTTLLSLVGFATHFYLSAKQREATYGVLRSIGMSPRELYGTLALEQVILILAGLALGTALGVILNQITLPGLPITLGDRPPVPPFVARNDWWAIGQIYLTLAAAFLVALGVATWMLWRTQIHRVLRIGEE